MDLPFGMIGSFGVGGWGVESWFSRASGEGAYSFDLISREMAILDGRRWISCPFSVVWLMGSGDKLSPGTCW